MNRYARPLLTLAAVGLLAACATAADEPSVASTTSPPPMGSPMSSIGSPMPSMGSPMPSASPSAMEGHGTASPATGELAEVRMDNFAFVEGRIEVSVGTAVTWINGDGTRHTVTSGDDDTADGEFDSGDIAAGDSFTLVFEEPGEYAYFCDIHPTMTGVVGVTP